MDSVAWNLIDKYFKDNPSNLVDHHLDSFNQFIEIHIPQIFKENNPVKYLEKEDTSNKDFFPKQCNLYLGGKDASKIYIGKPVIFDEQDNKDYPHFMYPNDARLRNMSYGLTIHYDIDAEFIYKNDDGEIVNSSSTINKVYLGKFPIMVQSKYCILNGLDRDVRYNLGECRNDLGGYFIIDGKEKVIVSQEKFADNMIYVKKHNKDDIFSYSAEVRSVSEDVSKPIRYTSVRMISPDTKLANQQIVVDIPNVRKPVPLFILMRALGIISDKEIIETCLLDLEKNELYIDFFIPSIHDASIIFNQLNALQFIGSLTKRQTISSAWDILTNYFLPHIGESNYKEKAYYIGYMVFKVLRVFNHQDKPTDRDSFKFKRVETSGQLLSSLFREYFILQNKNIALQLDKEFYYHMVKYQNNNDSFASIFDDKSNLKKIFSDLIVETGFRKAFKGNWGGSANTKKLGVVQDLNRLSYFTYISQVRKLNLPMESSSKAVGPHQLHNSQWGIIDPVDTPDGGNVGLHKHLAISTKNSMQMSIRQFKNWFLNNAQMKQLIELSPYQIFTMTKVFLNGNWVGCLEFPIETFELFKLYRANGLIPIFTSIRFIHSENEIHVYSDAGRLLRPIFYKDYRNKVSFDRKEILEKIENNNYSWKEAVCGFANKNANLLSEKIYSYEELFPSVTKENIIDKLYENSSVIQYIDTSEEEGSLIAYNMEQWSKNRLYTHLEIHGSLILGVMGNSVIFPENNQLPRDVFSCGQSRQAVSVYHTNSQMRIDKMGVILNYGQIPLVKSKYLEYINKEEQPYGVNTIVAIMSYSGYNVEDAILVNEGSIKRGLFNTTYYTSYESKEKSEKISGTTTNSHFANIEQTTNVKNLRPGYDYSFLDENGLVKENTPLNDKIIVIGKIDSSTEQPNFFTDSSSKTKKGQVGFVDKSFMSEGEEGKRIAKVRIREERIPAIGDKMASRAGQKGTIGLIIPERDMPYTAGGLRPDLIINPHAIPSRMTIGQLIESVLGKLGLKLGYFGDCTAFQTKGSNLSVYGDILVKNGFQAYGDELLYSGYTGEQLDGNIFIGPTYYMRLKHMVKDKINYRARGPRNVLTRQTVQGRANDGGLRIGEMERDGILGHGAAYMLTESFMERGDEYYLAICNKSGSIAVYNKSLNIFFSPFVDGPIHFNKDKTGMPILDVFSKFGRSFSIVRIPYALKLLIQELQVMNVQMRIITDKNIDQVMNLGFQNKNLETLVKYRTDNHLVSEELEKILTLTQSDENTTKSTTNFITLYKNVLRNKIIGKSTKTEIIPTETEDFQSYKKGDEVIYIRDQDKERKWIIKKILNMDSLIQTNQLENLPTMAKLNANKDTATLLVKIDNLIPYKDYIDNLESSDKQSLVYNVNSPAYNNISSDDIPYLNLPQTNMDSPQYAIDTPSNQSVQSNTNMNSPQYAIDTPSNQSVQSNTNMNSPQYAIDTPSNQSIQSKQSITPNTNNNGTIEQSPILSGTNESKELDFSSTNFIKKSPSSDKLDILEVDETNTNEEKKDEEDDSSNKKIVSFDK